MEIKEITIQEVDAIYNQHMVKDFPPNELKPLNMIKKLIQSGRSRCYGLFSSGFLKAYALFYQPPGDRILLIDYYAVISTERNKKYGSTFLKLLQNQLKDYEGLLVEVEQIEKAKNEKDRKIRKKRIDFYIKNGMIKTHVACHLFGVDYTILYLPLLEKYDDKLVYSKLSELYRSMIPAKLYNENVRIWMCRE